MHAAQCQKQSQHGVCVTQIFLLGNKASLFGYQNVPIPQRRTHKDKKANENVKNKKNQTF